MTVLWMTGKPPKTALPSLSEKALFPHFREEEYFVLSLLDDADPYKQRTLFEHMDIKATIAALDDCNGREAKFLLKLAGMLDDHIRFEERELFPYLQDRLTASQLEEMGNSINRDHKPFIEDFHTEFWNTHAG